MTLGILEILVAEAKNLREPQFPFVKCLLDTVKTKTTVCGHGGACPSWNQTLKMELFPNQRTLIVEVWSSKDLTDELIGRGSLSLDVVLATGCHDAWIALMEPIGVYLGEVHIVARFYGKAGQKSAISLTENQPLTEVADSTLSIPQIPVSAPLPPPTSTVEESIDVPTVEFHPEALYTISTHNGFLTSSRPTIFDLTPPLRFRTTPSVFSLFSLVPINSYYFMIIHAKTQKALDIKGFDMNPGAPALLWDQNRDLNQQFDIVPARRKYCIIAAHSKLFLTTSLYLCQDTYPQEWAIQEYTDRVFIFKPKLYSIQNVMTNEFLCVLDGLVFLQSAVSNLTLHPKPRGYQIGSDGKVFDVAGQSHDDGAAILMWKPNGQWNQVFDIIPEPQGFLLVAQHSKKCIAIRAGRVIQETRNGSRHQLWLIQ
jgi:hypothetical protein